MVSGSSAFSRIDTTQIKSVMRFELVSMWIPWIPFLLEWVIKELDFSQVSVFLFLLIFSKYCEFKKGKMAQITGTLDSLWTHEMCFRNK